MNLQIDYVDHRPVIKRKSFSPHAHVLLCTDKKNNGAIEYTCWFVYNREDVANFTTLLDTLPDSEFAMAAFNMYIRKP